MPPPPPLAGLPAQQQQQQQGTGGSGTGTPSNTPFGQWNPSGGLRPPLFGTAPLGEDRQRRLLLLEGRPPDLLLPLLFQV